MKKNKNTLFICPLCNTFKSVQNKQHIDNFDICFECKYGKIFIKKNKNEWIKIKNIVKCEECGHIHTVDIYKHPLHSINNDTCWNCYTIREKKGLCGMCGGNNFESYEQLSGDSFGFDTEIVTICKDCGNHIRTC